MGTTFLAAQFIDLLWPFFLLAGIEKVAIEPGNTASTPLNFISYPYSHGLLAVLLWALLFGGLYYAVQKDTRSAALLSLLVLSHWVLDFITHRPDLPLSFSEETKVGLGLWNQKGAAMAVEAVLFIVGCYFYLTATRPRNKTGSVATWSFIIIMVVLYIMNALGDPPPSVTVLAYVGLAQWLFVAWGYWIDRNRMPVGPKTVSTPAMV